MGKTIALLPPSSGGGGLSPNLAQTAAGGAAVQGAARNNLGLRPLVVANYDAMQALTFDQAVGRLILVEDGFRYFYLKGTIPADDGDWIELTDTTLEKVAAGGPVRQATAQINLGLGNAATRDVGNTAGTVCAGDDPRLSGAGATSWPIEAGAMIPRTVGGAGIAGVATAGHNVNYDAIEFDWLVEQFVQFWTKLPNNWNGGPFAVDMDWEAPSGVNGNQIVMAAAARAYADGDALDQVRGVPQLTTDTFTAPGLLRFTPLTPLITPAGAPAVGQPLLIEISRKVNEAADNLGAVVRLKRITIHYNL